MQGKPNFKRGDFVTVEKPKLNGDVLLKSALIMNCRHGQLDVTYSDGSHQAFSPQHYKFVKKVHESEEQD